MLDIFFYKDTSFYRWYVLNGNNVLDEGIAKSATGAESKAYRSKTSIEASLIDDTLEGAFA